MVSPEELQIIFNFIGYGRLDAPLWFLGREEGLGKHPKREGWSLEWEVNVRASWNRVMDARQAHMLLEDPYWLERNRSDVWKFAAMAARGLLLGAEDWQDSDLAWQYVVEHLGRSHGDTLIGESFPLPKANVVSWPYSDLYPDQKTYKQEIWPQRQSMWQGLLDEHCPRFVIAFGGWWQSRRETFGVLNWVPLNDGRVETAQMPNGTQIYLTPFFGRGMLKMEVLRSLIEHGGQSSER